MWQFSHEEIIDAPVEAVFRLIVDLPDYQNWNPFLIEAAGDVAVGGVVFGKSALGRFTTSYRHEIFELIPNQRLCWRDFGFPALFVCGERSRFIEQRGDKTAYRCHLKIAGLLSGFVNFMFGDGLRNGIVAEAKAMNAKLSKPSS